MLNIVRGNRLEVLADVLASLIITPDDNPFEKQTIIIGSKGLGGWLELQLAGKNGVCANVRMPFAESWLWEAFGLCLEDVPSVSHFAPDALLWPVLDYLQHLPHDDMHAPLWNWLHEADDAGYLMLASRIAQVFDKYLIYRPDMILEWEKGVGEHWQAIMWRHLSARVPGRHRARLTYELIQLLDKGGKIQGKLPPIIYIFGVSSLPPIFIRLFKMLGQCIEIYWFVLDPCLEYWGSDTNGLIGSEYLLNQSVIKNSNPFLVSLGQQGREFLDYLLEENAADIDVFVKPGSLTLLNALQQDILDDFDREEGDRLLLLDDSIRVHICHSQMREIEVLYDCLLDLIERHDIYPADIIVMAPDIESYAPYIEAVFGNAPQNRKLPYQIVDRLPIGDRRIIDSFLWLMSLPRHRFEIEEILSLLENPAIARKFDLEPLDRDQIEKWVASLRICWGLDAQHRLDLGLPGYSEHTWRWGIERMLLGFAMPVNGLYASRLPYVEIEGQSAVILGKLCAFLEKLSNWRHILSQAYSVNKWEPTLYKLLEDFFDCPDEQIVIFEHMRMRIENFFESARLSGYSGDVSHVFLCGALSGRLSDVAAYGFLHGGVTFCSMISMRSVPFRVVYLLGLNDAGYPHRDKNVDFDLVAQSRKAGDWSRRNDDCYQFLESIISARDHFYISYVGRDIRDNSVLSPSPLVSNLMIILNKGYIKCENDVNPVVVHHPLKPYSPEYFIGQKNLFSYSEAMCRASKGKRQLTAPTPFFEFKHVAYEEETEEIDHIGSIDLKNLLRFFKNPSRWFLKMQLGLDFGEQDNDINSREPFVSAGLDAYNLKKLQLKSKLEGVLDEQNDHSLIMARELGLLPQGDLGVFQYKSKLMEVEKLVLSSGFSGGRLPALSVNYVASRFSIQGELNFLTQSGAMIIRPSKWKASYLIHAWICHLIFSVTRLNDIKKITHYVTEDGAWYFNPVPETDARSCLEDLAQAWHLGNSYPLPFFPESSYAFALALSQGREKISAGKKAWGKFYSSWALPAATGANDPFVELAWRGCNPLGADFEFWAERLISPLIKYVVKQG